MLLTKNQLAVLNRLVAMGQLYFSGHNPIDQVTLRLFPLVIGPTGVGKSMVVSAAARHLGAHYLRVTRGDWLVLGARQGRPTMYRILDHLYAYGKLAVHIDELDKFSRLGGAEWSASLGADLWNLIDLKFQLDAYIADSNFGKDQKPTEEQLANLVREKLWLVGSGTWEAVFRSHRAGAKIGFGGAVRSETVASDAIARSGKISPELLHRFGEPTFLEYPTSKETELLLTNTGLKSLAREIGVNLSAKDIDWSQGGMRNIETLATRLVLQWQEKRKGAQRELPLGDTSGDPWPGTNE